MKINKRKTYKHCVRCDSVGMIFVDFGKMGKLWLCSVCWIGLAGAMYRDFKVYLNDSLDFMNELKKASDRENWMKENNH